MRVWLAAWMLAGCGVDDARPTATRQEVVGGRAEDAYPAIGYLMQGTPLQGPRCGATVIHPHAAVTAAHCIQPGLAHGLGFGAAGSGPGFKARRVVVHPGYGHCDQRYHHDVAVLVLEDAPELGALPRIVALSEESGFPPARYVGYGRVTPGGYDVMTGNTDERKSAGQTIGAVDPRSVWVTGVGGGLCWGDSGGPLVSEDGSEIYGVLSDFGPPFTCAIGNEMIFVNLAGERAFIEAAIAGDEDAGTVFDAPSDPFAGPRKRPERTPMGRVGCSQTGASFALLGLLAFSRPWRPWGSRRGRSQ